jgi:hypothetical protein
MALARIPLLVLAAGAALALLPLATARASPGSCSRAVLADWSDGRIDRGYPAACYRQALRVLPEDLRVYGTAQYDIRRALLSTAGGSRASAPAAAAAAPASAGWPWWLVFAVACGALAGLVALVSLRAARVRRRS